MNKSNLNNWSISEEMLNWLLDNIPKDSKILEFGSGTGTIELAEHYDVTSIENNPKWAYLSDKAKYILCRIDEKILWYNHDDLFFNINPNEYKVIIIDGPTKKDGNRLGILKYLDKFNKNSVFIIDDTHRPLEKKLSSEIIKFTNRDWLRISCNRKSFDIV